jgi:hypothetical protein
VMPRRGRTVEKPSHEKGIGPATLRTTERRKPYQKLAFKFERVFETTALACGKANTTQMQCVSNLKNS